MSFLIMDGVGYGAEAKTLFRNMTSPADSGRKRIINNLIKRLKGDGTWGLLDVFWVMASHNQQASRLNWKTPGTYTLTETNAPTWTLDKGYTGNGSNMYLNTGFTPSTNGVNFIQNSAALGAYSRSDVAGAAAYDMGSNTPTPTRFSTLNIRWSDDTFQSNINDDLSMSSSNTTTLGLYSTVRTSSTATAQYKNGVSAATGSDTSVGLPASAAYIICRNNDGTAAGFTSKQYAMAYIGSGSINQLLLFNAIEEYMDAIGSGIV